MTLTSCLAKKAKAVDEAALMRESRPPQAQVQARTATGGGRVSAPTSKERSFVPVPATPQAPKAPQKSNPLPNDRLRMPEMLELPEDKELRSGTPGKSSSGGAVISRPPSE